MTTVEWEPPRCSHGYILLGCPHIDCVEQSEYLAQQDAALAEFEQSMAKVFEIPPTDDDRS